MSRHHSSTKGLGRSCRRHRFSQPATVDGGKESTTLEFSASVKATIMKVVEASVSAKYGTTLERTKAKGLTYPIKIPPFTRMNILVGGPMVRTTGDFTVTMANTTWRMPNVQFSTPTAADFGPAITVDPIPLTPRTRRACRRPFWSDTNPTARGPPRPRPRPSRLRRDDRSIRPRRRTRRGFVGRVRLTALCTVSI